MICRFVYCLFLFTAFHGMEYDGQWAQTRIFATRKQNDEKMVIRIGKESFEATLFDNPTAKAFTELLPLTVTMTELNANEKYSELKKSLPTNKIIPGRIQSGDLMLYGSSTLVLFYQSFQTSYPYTPIGRVNNPAQLAVSLGAENVIVKFELK